MEKENLIKTGFYGLISVIGGGFGQLFGGFDALFIALLTCSVIDYFSGGIVAVVFKNSPKTETGGAQSKAGFIGLVKKIFIYLLIVVAVKIDVVIESNGLIRNAAVVGFMLNEILSIFENAGLMGIKLPPALINAIDILKKKSDVKEERDTNEK